MREHHHNHQTRKMRKYQIIPQVSVLKATSVRKVRTKSQEAYAGSHSKKYRKTNYTDYRQDYQNGIAFLIRLKLRVLDNHHFRRVTLKHIFPSCIPKYHPHPFRKLLKGTALTVTVKYTVPHSLLCPVSSSFQHLCQIFNTSFLHSTCLCSLLSHHSGMFH